MAINSSKVDEEQKEVLKSATIRRLFSYLKNYKRQVAVVLVVLAVTIAISTVNPLLLEYAIDVNIAQKDWRGLVALCVFMVVINLVSCVSTDEWYYAGYYTDFGYEANYDVYDLSGWGPDYGDPTTYLDTFLPDYAGYMIKCIGIY